MKVQSNNVNSFGGILYLEDAMEITLSSSLTASSIISVDSRFTVTLLDAGTASGYEVQVSNINPFIKVSDQSSITGTGSFSSGGHGNAYPDQNNIQYSINPDLEDSWVTLSAFSGAGYYICDGFFRLMRIVNSGGFSNGKAYVFAEKISPVIR